MKLLGFFKKKATQSPVVSNLRRRYHHGMIAQRKGLFSNSKRTLLRPRRFSIKSRFADNPILGLFKWVSFVIAGVGIIIGLGYTIFFSSFFTITKVSAESSGTSVTEADLEPFLKKYNGQNNLFVSEKAISQELSQAFKNKILLVKIKKSYPHRLTVIVEEYPAVFNLRVTTPKEEQRIVVNQLGYAIGENTERSGIPTLSVTASAPFDLTKPVLDKERTDLIIGAFSQFSDLFGMAIKNGTWLKVERELHLTTERNFSVWLDLTQPIDVQLKKLKKALPKLDIYHESLAYIDLRIAGADNEKVIFMRKK